jgi:hypothetical protein
MRMLVVGSDKLCLRYDVPQTVRTRHRAWPNSSGTSPCLNKSIEITQPPCSHCTDILNLLLLQLFNSPTYQNTP